MPSPLYSDDNFGGLFLKAHRLLPKDALSSGLFQFDIHPHDTGVSVRIFIIKDGNPILEIVNTTYWYSSRYTFNDSKWEQGAWTPALNAALEELGTKVDAESAAREARKVARLEAEAAKDAEAKALAEALFAAP